VRPKKFGEELVNVGVRIPASWKRILEELYGAGRISDILRAKIAELVAEEVPEEIETVIEDLELRMSYLESKKQMLEKELRMIERELTQLQSIIEKLVRKKEEREKIKKEEEERKKKLLEEIVTKVFVEDQNVSVNGYTIHGFPLSFHLKYIDEKTSTWIFEDCLQRIREISQAIGMAEEEVINYCRENLPDFQKFEEKIGVLNDLS